MKKVAGRKFCYVEVSASLALVLYITPLRLSPLSRRGKARMQRQKSILSFLRPPAGNRSSVGGSPSSPQLSTKERGNSTAASGQSAAAAASALDSAMEVRGIDTPPEKVPRQIFPSKSPNGGSSLFSSIMHKFAKVDDKANGK